MMNWKDWLFMSIVVLVYSIVVCKVVYSSESPQRDQYKLDYCDFCFNNRDKPTVLANHVKYHTGRNSDGSRLLKELNLKIQKHERAEK